jgi:hypothetical protein
MPSHPSLLDEQGLVNERIYLVSIGFHTTCLSHAQGKLTENIIWRQPHLFQQGGFCPSQYLIRNSILNTIHNFAGRKDYHFPRSIIRKQVSGRGE